jgi:hypothetical protein
MCQDCKRRARTVLRPQRSVAPFARWFRPFYPKSRAWSMNESGKAAREVVDE